MTRHVRPVALSAALLLLAIARPAPAAEGPVPRGPSHEPVPFRYDPAQWKAVPKEFLDDAPAVYLYAGTTHLVGDDGTVETIAHEVIRLNGRKGIEQLGEYRSIYYDPSFEKLTLHEARVHKPDGKVIAVEPRHLRLRDANTDYYVYDHFKELVISFPSLEVGDCLEVKWTVRGKDPEHQGQFFTRYAFGNDACPVVADELRVRLPKDKELKHATVGGKLGPAVTEEDGTRTYHWRATNRQAAPADERVPSAEESRLQVVCSTFASWDEVARWNRQLLADRWACTPPVKKVVREVTKDLKTPLEKARALTYWVRRNVRYVSTSVAGENHGFTPHAPEQVLAYRYGDCKDGVQLLAVLLREAGVPAALVTLNTRGSGQLVEAVPSPAGDHALLLVTLDGQDHWIDTTARPYGWDFLPAHDRDRACYALDEGGLRLLRTPRLTARDNRTEQTTHAWPRPDGTLRCERAATYEGLAACARREDWAETPAGERRRLVVTELQNAHDQARLTKLAFDEARLKDHDQPVSARFEFDIPGKTGLPEASVHDPVVWNKLLALTLDLERASALDLGQPFEAVHRYVVHLPPGHRLVSKPRGRAVRSKWGTFALKVQTPADDPWRVELEFTTRLEKTRVEPADFAAFLKFQAEVDDAHVVLLAWHPTGDLADAPALEKAVEKDPADGAAALLLARLYLDKGKHEDARRVLQRALQADPKAAGPAELLLKVADATAKQAAADRGRAYYQLAQSAFAQDKYAKALEHFEAAAKADPAAVQSAAALEFKGRLCEKLGRPKDAAAAYRQLLQADSDDNRALAALVPLALAAGDRAEALDHLRRLTVRAGTDAALLARAADLHLRLERYDDALDLAQRSHKATPNADAERVLGLVYLHRGDSEKAVQHLNEALRLTPEKTAPDESVLTGLVRARLARGELGEAEPLVARVKAKAVRELVDALVKRREAILKEAKAPPDKADVFAQAADRLACAERAYAEGKPAAQVEALLAADEVELGPACALRGLLALEKGRLTDALAHAERAVALSPAEARGYYVRGRVRLERGAAGALADLEKAAELGGRKDAAVLHWLAAALAQAGRLQDATAVQREAAKQKPDDRDIAEQLRRFERQAGSR